MDCKLYVESNLTVDQIAERVNAIYPGKHKFGYFKSDLFEVDIEDNEEASPKGARKGRDRFLYFPIIMSFESKPGLPTEKFKEIVKRVMTDLQSNGGTVIAACDFEEELPQSFNVGEN